MKQEERLFTDPTIGLTTDDVARNRAAFGENLLSPPKKVSLWKLYIEKYQDPIIQILLVAAAISLALAIVEREYIETFLEWYQH